ncbi:hypothetical protein [Phytoactinopolyspora halotolerans]|uniref:Uncharacterized protein n=1 Tax=Phytoactinopolyspora halotolerans TaxID=1981512 RepID=A0A6L9SGM8_9ACTN|nr:hypothetical protein [Phytoactinopolyspora halotolerans]NEE04309.1 hypothetical protein [Phytoactinopolyspora halotolerans]
MSGLTESPAVLPVLSRGKHRRPRKGACFMEFASFLAGERWSDHPDCTHPLLASMARQVNDVVADSYRPRLAELVPAVIGVNGDDPHLDAIIARRAAATALPVAAAWRQRVLSVALLSAERVLAELDGRPADSISDMSQRALAHAPDATKWARSFSVGAATTPRGFRRHAGPTAVRCSVEGIAQACAPDTDRMLHDLLARTIEDCRQWSQLRTPATPDAGRWEDACKLTGVSAGGVTVS